MNSDAYINTVTSGLKEYKTRLQKKELTFMQDNASCHKSQKTMDFFKKEGYEPMVWPFKSPDLNPIENVWSIVQQELWKRREEIMSY